MRSVQYLLLLLGLLTFSSANAAVLIPVAPVPGSTSMGVYGINDNNVISGYYYTADGREHAFFGSLGGQYTTFDYGLTYTEARDINNAGYITGRADTSAGNIEFERYPNGSIHVITMNGVPLTRSITQGINSKGVFVGNGYDTSNHRHAFYGKKGKYRQEFTLPDNSTDPEPRGISNNGAVVGHSFNQGFLLQNGVETIINYPDPNTAYTFLQDVNNKGVITGFWDDANFDNDNAFLFDGKSSTFIPINVPNATQASAAGINKAGLVAVNTDVGSFIYCPHAQTKCPGNGVEIADPKPIRLAPGKMLLDEHRPDLHPATGVTPELPGRRAY